MKLNGNQYCKTLYVSANKDKNLNLSYSMF